jgi:hypothetical protein
MPRCQEVRGISISTVDMARHWTGAPLLVSWQRVEPRSTKKALADNRIVLPCTRRWGPIRVWTKSAFYALIVGGGTPFGVAALNMFMQPAFLCIGTVAFLHLAEWHACRWMGLPHPLRLQVRPSQSEPYFRHLGLIIRSFRTGGRTWPRSKLLDHKIAPLVREAHVMQYKNKT